jgi:hypothetical protein
MTLRGIRRADEHKRGRLTEGRIIFAQRGEAVPLLCPENGQADESKQTGRSGRFPRLSCLFFPFLYVDSVQCLLLPFTVFRV